jgi:hypothetical protein
MEGNTPDQVEQALLEEEAAVARARGRQMKLIQIADAMQLPTADGATGSTPDSVRDGFVSPNPVTIRPEFGINDFSLIQLASGYDLSYSRD